MFVGGAAVEELGSLLALYLCVHGGGGGKRGLHELLKDRCHGGWGGSCLTLLAVAEGSPLMC